MSILHSPYRYFAAAALLAALMCLLPIGADAPDQSPEIEPTPPPALTARQTPEAPPGQPVGADLSERTQAGCFLHRTLVYAPCGHSVQSRTALPTALVGLSRTALEDALDSAFPGATLTGFAATEVDIAQRTDIPCPLHWVLRSGEDGKLAVLQNVTGEALSVVRETEVTLQSVADETEREALRDGRVFDDVQALEGYLESLSS